MLRSLRTPRAGLLALALAALTLLPPAGWALCVAPGGHVEVEPVATDGGAGCCTIPEDANSHDAAAAAGSDCDACHDLTAFDGDTARCRPQDDAAPGVCVPALATLILAADAAWIAMPARMPCDCAPPGARLSTVILRN